MLTNDQINELAEVLYDSVMASIGGKLPVCEFRDGLYSDRGIELWRDGKRVSWCTSIDDGHSLARSYELDEEIK